MGVREEPWVPGAWFESPLTPWSYFSSKLKTQAKGRTEKSFVVSFVLASIFRKVRHFCHLSHIVVNLLSW